MTSIIAASWHDVTCLQEVACRARDENKLARSGLCLDLRDRFRIAVIRILDEFLVCPASPTVAPPYHSPNEPTGNRSPRTDYPPEMPGIRPPLSQIGADGGISFAAVGHQ